MCYCSETPDHAWDILRRLKSDIRMASPLLLEAIRAWFVRVGHEWEVSDATINDEGVHATDPSVRLQPVSA